MFLSDPFTIYKLCIEDINHSYILAGKMDPYIKRCAASKITSAEKLMYICKNQLGMKKNSLYFILKNYQ